MNGCETCGHPCKCGIDYCQNHRAYLEIQDDIKRLKAAREEKGYGAE